MEVQYELSTLSLEYLLDSSEVASCMQFRNWQNNRRSGADLQKRNSMTSFILSSCDARDAPYIGGRGAFTVDMATAEEACIEHVVTLPSVALYCYHIGEDAATELWFLPVTDAAALDAAPFLDRAVRALASVGERAFCFSLADATLWISRNSAPASSLPLVVPWNTGRSGSTLVHRIFAAAGVVSLSEPFWLDQLARAQAGADPALATAETRAILLVCTLIDSALARLRLSASAEAIVSLNPNSLAHSLRRDVDAIFPQTRHLFLYRPCIEVAESCVSTFYRNAKLADPTLTREAFRVAGFGPPPFRSDDFCAGELREKTAAPLPLPRDSSAARLAATWIDGVVTWLRFAEDVPATRRASMRIDGLVCEGDLAQRVANVRSLLEWCGALARPTEEEELAAIRRGIDAFVAAPPEQSTVLLRAALGCFQPHSTGSAGAAGATTGQTAYLTEEDCEEVRAMVAAVPLLVERGVCVDGIGAYIGGSIGLR